MKLPNFAVNRPVTVTMLVFIVLMLGFVSFTNISVDLFPDFDLPYLMVMTTYEGAGPEEVENLVTRPLEGSLGQISGIDEMLSQSSAGNSMIMVAMNWGTDMNFAALDIREKIDFIADYLPPDAKRPMVLQADPSMMPILQIGITGAGGDLVYLKNLADDKVLDRLLRIEGVASAYLSGGITREIQVVLDPTRLHAYNLSVDQVMGALASENINFSTGRLVDGNREYFVRTTAQYQDIEDIANVVLPLPQGGQVYLRHLGEIRDTHKDIAQITRLNGKPSIGIHVLKQSKTNTVRVVNSIKAELKKLEKELPENVQISIGFDQAQYINESIEQLKQNILLGGVLAIVVLLLFLRNLRSTLVIATAMPISIISTFMLIYFNNLTLNMMTMGAIALGIGMMVDNAIVILENIYRHGQEGFERIEAAKQGANEVSSAVVASTLTTLAVFLPIVFVDGIAAELFKDLALTISFALAVSLLVALTLVPMLASKLLAVDGNQAAKEAKQLKKQGVFKKATGSFGSLLDRLKSKYTLGLKWALRHRKTVVLGVTALLIASLTLTPLIGMSFIPSMDSGEIYIDVELDKGTLVSRTDAVAYEIEQYLETIPEIDNIYTSVAPSSDAMTGLGSAATEKLSIRLMLVDIKHRSRSSAVVADQVRKFLVELPGAQTNVNAIDMGSISGLTPIQVKVKGSDLGVLKELSEQIKEVLEQVPGTREVEVPLTEGNAEYRIVVDRGMAAQYGLGVAQIANSARIVLEGQVATRLRVGGEEIDVRVMYDEAYSGNLKALKDAYLVSPAGFRVPLSMVAKVESGIGSGVITRENQNRVSTVSAQLLGRDLGSVMKDIEEQIDAEIKLPQGYVIEFGGEMEEMVDAFSSLFLALLLAIVLVYMVMASQFESLVHPFVIMFSMPTTVIGVILGLALTGNEFSVPVFIGVIMLAGIVVNNAIILVDYINQQREKKLTREDAIVTAGLVRLRPILMTTLTTVLAMLPTAVGLGTGSEVAAPMAIAVISGLSVSTVFTLILIPVIYTLFDDLGDWLKKKADWERFGITIKQGKGA